MDRRGVEAPAGATRGRRTGALLAGMLVTALAIGLPGWEPAARWITQAARPLASLRPHTAQTLVLLAFGLVLAVPARASSGLVIGRVREHWPRVLLVCGLPVLATALVYPQLPERPFGGAGIEMWLVSPLAQDLIFMGWLYGRLDRAFPAYVHEALRIRRAVPLGGAFFAAWHLQNLAGGMSSGFVAFQLAYTATGYVVTGLSRQWTGSMLYATASHSAVNFIAWWAS